MAVAAAMVEAEEVAEVAAVVAAIRMAASAEAE